MKQFTSWNLPLVLLICFVVLMGYKFNERKNLTAEAATTKRLVDTAKATLEKDMASQNEAYIRVADQTKDEESEFVNNLRRMAAENNLTFVRWQTMTMPKTVTAPATTAIGTQAATPTASAEQPIVEPKKATVEISGAYSQIRDMMEKLIAGNRYVVVESATWDRVLTGPNSKLNFQLIRFVSSQKASTTPSDTNQGRGSEQVGSQ